MLFWLFLAAVTLFRLLIGQYLPLIGDEAYYWLWSKNLALSYVDHPPLIAYYIKGLTLLFGQTEFAIRLGAVFMVTLTTVFVYKIGKELFNDKVGTLTAIIFSLTPMFLGGSFFLVPQQLFLLFWAVSCYVFTKLIKTAQSYWWYVLGLTVGLGLLSDYVMFLFFPAVGLVLMINKNPRGWWSKKEPYLGALLSLLIFSPVIIWNIQQGFTPAYYVSQRAAGSPNYLQNFTSFLALELALFTPILFGVAIYLVCILIKQAKTLSGGNLLLACLSAPVLIVFLLISPFLLVGGHWPAAAYIPAILFISQLNNKTGRWLVGLTVVFGLLVNILAFTYYLALYPTPKELIGQESSINKDLSVFLELANPKTGRTYYFANNLGLAGLVAFHGKIKIYLAPGRLKQFDLWGQPRLEKGDHVIYFVLNEKEMADKLKPLFQTVTAEPQKRLFTKDADIPNKTGIYHCLSYRGGELP